MLPFAKPDWYVRVKEGGSNLPQRPAAAEDAHEHSWQKFKQIIVPDNPHYDYRHSQTCLIVLACPDCKEKRYVDLYMG